MTSARPKHLSVLALVSTTILAGCAPQAEPAAKPSVMVEVVSAQRAPHPNRQILTGSVAAKAQTPAAFLITGRLISLDAEVGGRVNIGDVLARVASAEPEADVEAASAGVAAAQSRLDQTKTALDRQEQLWAQGLTTRSALDGARTAWETANSTAESAQAQLELAQEALSYTELKARAAGVIIRKLANADEVVQAGAPVYVIAEDGARNALINVQESAIAGWDMNREVSVSLLSDPDQVSLGRITEIAPALDNTGTVPVKVEVDGSLALGVPVSVQLEIDSGLAVVLPAQALTQIDGQASVWIVADDDTVAPRPVTIERYETGQIVISDGLESDERVVVSGGQFLAPGLKVVTQEASQL